MDFRFIIYFFRSIFKRVSAGVFPRSLHQDASYCDRGIWWRYPGLVDQDSPDTLSYFLTWLCIARSSPRDTRDNLWWGHFIGTLKPMHWNVVVCCPSRAQKVCTVGGVKSACKDPSFAHFCKLDVATSRMAFLDLNLHVLQHATSNSNNWGRSEVQNCTSDTP